MHVCIANQCYSVRLAGGEILLSNVLISSRSIYMYNTYINEENV